jgi:CheY-like chemotaxis protein
VGEERQILVVDDDDCHRSSLGDFLRDEGFVVFEAPNGQVALDYLLAARTIPSLILLDLNMPVMSGSEMLRILKGHLRLTNIPIVVITGEPASTRPRDVDGTLTKPYSFDDLKTLVQKHTTSVGSTDAPRTVSRVRSRAGTDN